MPPYEPANLPMNLCGIAIHLIGVKGTGMCALAEILIAAGAKVTGSDIKEEFYTDGILKALGVSVLSFSAQAIPADTAYVIRSAAYDESNPTVAQAVKGQLPMMTYPEALGCLSQRYDSSALAGVHGKTTTTALAGALLKAAGLPAIVVAGSAVSGFGDRSTWHGGDRFFVAETCEYRRHFLHFHPRRIVLTSVEADHQDYYPDFESIRTAFIDFAASLPPGGLLIYCADDKGAQEVAQETASRRRDIELLPYGQNAQGPWRLRFAPPTPGCTRFSLEAFDVEFSLKVPGHHVALDAVAALALTDSLSQAAGTPMDPHTAVWALENFRGSRRRSEIVGEINGILVMDDYAHHPTAIETTLKGLREFYPHRRLVVDFMPHTYSRTAALMENFAGCFVQADVLILHPIYASAREVFHGDVTGWDLFERTRDRQPACSVLYCDTFDNAAGKLMEILRPGDLFITLGAGNNWCLGRRFLKENS